VLSRRSTNASSVRPTDLRSTRAVKPVITLAPLGHRRRADVPAGCARTRARVRGARRRLGRQRGLEVRGGCRWGIQSSRHASSHPPGRRWHTHNSSRCRPLRVFVSCATLSARPRTETCRISASRDTLAGSHSCRPLSGARYRTIDNCAGRGSSGRATLPGCRCGSSVVASTPWGCHRAAVRSGLEPGNGSRAVRADGIRGSSSTQGQIMQN
jgi:hypothetical protein